MPLDGAKTFGEYIRIARPFEESLSSLAQEAEALLWVEIRGLALGRAGNDLVAVELEVHL